MTANTLFVGIDIHRKSNTCCLMDGQGNSLSQPFNVENNLPGSQTLIKQIAHQVIQGNFDSILIAAEATGWYWWHLFYTLYHDPFLNQWPLELYPLNPRLTANFKKTYSDLDKTDLIDAFVIADRLRLGRDLPHPFYYDDLYLPLRFLTRHRFHLIHRLAQEKAYCLSFIYLKFSEYTSIKPFANTFGAASKAVLQEFASIEEIAAIPFDELTRFINQKGKRRFSDPARNAHKLKLVAQHSYPLPQTLQQPINLILEMNLQLISFLEQQEKMINQAIAEYMQAIPHTLDTIPGMGPVFSAGIIAEIGDLARFDFDQAKVAAYAGFKWRRRQSADFEAEETSLSRKGNRYLRYYFCEAANRVRMCAQEYAAYYWRKYQEVRKHQHKRAIVLTARKLIRLVVRLLTTHQPYQPRRQ